MKTKIEDEIAEADSNRKREAIEIHIQGVV